MFMKVRVTGSLFKRRKSFKNKRILVEIEKSENIAEITKVTFPSHKSWYFFRTGLNVTFASCVSRAIYVLCVYRMPSSSLWYATNSRYMYILHHKNSGYIVWHKKRTLKITIDVYLFEGRVKPFISAIYYWYINLHVIFLHIEINIEFIEIR